MNFFRRIYSKLYRLLSGDVRIVLFPRRLLVTFLNPAIKKVFILTYCKTEEQLYGTTLIFKSLRTGFPTSVIVVIDNASILPARKVIKKLAAEARCEYIQLESEIPHHVYLEDLIMNQSLAGTVVNLDPDIVFWNNCENWHFKALLAGSFTPTYRGEFSLCTTKPRIHTSFYWIQDIHKLKKRIDKLKHIYFEFDPFRPCMFTIANSWQRFDTGGTLCAAIQKDCHYFTSKEHDAYDHLYGGTHLNLFVNNMENKRIKKHLLDNHEHAKTDYTQLRGIWRTQLKYLHQLK